MTWRHVGLIATVGFAGMALFVTGAPDPLLPFLVYVGAATTALSVARGRPVHRWISVILVVLPAELALISLLFEPPEQRAIADTPAEVLTRRAALASLGMLCVATWSALLAVARPHHDASTPEL